MSRYVFAASAALFAVLLLILAFSIAQRDARISHTLPADSVPKYADEIIAPISVHKAAFDDVTSMKIPRLEAHAESLETPLSSPTIPASYEESARLMATPGGEPPRFDAARILTKRRSDPDVAMPPPDLLSVPMPTSPSTALNDFPERPSVRELTPPSETAAPALPAPSSIPSGLSAFPSPPAVATLGVPQPPPPPQPAPQPFAATTSPIPAPSTPPWGEEKRAASSAIPNPTAERSAKSERGTWSMSSGSPGARQFDGSQNPSLEVIKRAPAEVQVGIAATFTAIVRNVGNATAYEVEVFDTVPRGSRLVRSVPSAQSDGADSLVWKLGELAAGDEATISMELVPESEGEIGSVASVKFAAQASVRTMSTLPKLSIKQWAPSEILGGDTIKVGIEVANVGTGTAKGVELQEDVPGAFRHVSGARSLGLEVGDLAPGESQRYEIELTAMEAAKISNVVRAIARNATTYESTQPIEIRAPKLQLQLNGPRIRYLERPAPFEAVIENIGTAVARDLYIVAYLPRGLHFSSANNEGTYLPEQHAIAWNLAELAAGSRAATQFTVLPVEEGKSVVRMTSDAEGLGVESIEREVQVEGQSELTFDIDDDHDPIETQGVTTYTIHLTNVGTRPDQEVALSVEAPDGSSVEHVESPMKYRVQGRTVVFEPLSMLPPKERTMVKVKVRHGREGTQIFRASVQSALRPVPVIKDESTQVYIDR